MSSQGISCLEDAIHAGRMPLASRRRLYCLRVHAKTILSTAIPPFLRAFIRSMVRWSQALQPAYRRVPGSPHPSFSEREPRATRWQPFLSLNLHPLRSQSTGQQLQCHLPVRTSHGGILCAGLLKLSHRVHLERHRSLVDITQQTHESGIDEYNTALLQPSVAAMHVPEAVEPERGKMFHPRHQFRVAHMLGLPWR
jgi:hypothetical protein